MRDSSFYQAQDGFIYLDLSTETYGCVIQMTWKQILSVLVDIGGLGLDSELDEQALKNAYGNDLQKGDFKRADAGVDWNYGGTAFHMVET